MANSKCRRCVVIKICIKLVSFAKYKKQGFFSTLIARTTDPILII